MPEFLCAKDAEHEEKVHTVFQRILQEGGGKEVHVCFWRFTSAIITDSAKGFCVRACVS